MNRSFFLGLSCFSIFISFASNLFAFQIPAGMSASHNVWVLKIQSNQIPDWCLNFIEDDHLIKACGIAESKSLSMARSRAAMDAKRQIADPVTGVISSTMEEIVTSILSNENEETTSKIEVITNSAIKKTKLSGYKIVQKHLIRGQTKYTYVVLIEYPKLLVNQAIVDEMKSEISSDDIRDELGAAIFELEKEIARQRVLQ